jgi:hypothetical protein
MSYYDDLREPLTDFKRDEFGKIVSAKDWLGNTVRVGEKVLYCIAAGRGQMMAIGTLLEINIVEREYGDWCDPSIKHVERELKTKVLTEKTSGQWNNEKRTKPANVNPMNITALPVTGKEV